MSQATWPKEAPLQGALGATLNTSIGNRLWSLLRSHWGLIPILLAFVLGNLLVSPFFESPMVDDWSYALAVKHLVEDHQFVVLGWAAVTLVSQTLWGALFSLPFGFSFSALHLSTTLLGLFGLLAFYALGRELGLGEGKSTFLALVVLLNPLHFGLSYTFMTDVPSTALTTIALWLYVLGIRKGAARWWVMGSIACGLAFLSRQTGIFVGLAAVAWIVLHHSSYGDLAKKTLAAFGIPLLVAAGFTLWLEVINSVPEGYTYNAAQLAKLPLEIAARNVVVLIPVGLFYLGLFTLPYLVGVLPEARFNWKTLAAAFVGIAVVVIMAFLLFQWRGWLMPYLRFGSIISPAGFGPNNILGDRPAILDTGGQRLLTVVAGAGAAALVAIGLRRLRLPWLFGASPVGLLGFAAAGQILWVLFGYLYLWEWFLFDRYYLPVLVPVLLLLGAVTQEIRLRWWLGAPVLVLFALFSIAASHDWIAFREAAWSGASSLVNQGVPLVAIDGGFEWDGWQLYEYSQAHLEKWDHPDASPFWIGRRVAPVITSEYVIAFSPLEGYTTVGTVPFLNWLALNKQEQLYILHRQEP